MSNHSPSSGKSSPNARPVAVFVTWSLTAILTAILLFLGTWQVHRLSEKKELIARVESRAYGEPQPLPLNWSTLGPSDNWEYSRVTMRGRFEHEKEVQVYTVTELGPGYWVFTPLSLTSGSHVLINRGFVPNEKRDPSSRIEGQTSGEVTVTGLMRGTETAGLFLRANDIASGRYYRRDVAQIAAAKDLTNAAPFYVDADAQPNDGGYPIGGKTQLKFPNSHLSYAITWYVLAVMMVAAGWFVSRNLNSTRKAEEDI